MGIPIEPRLSEEARKRRRICMMQTNRASLTSLPSNPLPAGDRALPSGLTFGVNQRSINSMMRYFQAQTASGPTARRGRLQVEKIHLFNSVPVHRWARRRGRRSGLDVSNRRSLLRFVAFREERQEEDMDDSDTDEQMEVDRTLGMDFERDEEEQEEEERDGDDREEEEREEEDREEDDREEDADEEEEEEEEEEEAGAAFDTEDDTHDERPRNRITRVNRPPTGVRNPLLSIEYELSAGQDALRRNDSGRRLMTDSAVSIAYVEDGLGGLRWELGCWAGVHHLSGVDMFQAFLHVLTEATTRTNCPVHKLWIKDRLENYSAVRDGIGLLKDLSAELHTSYDKNSNYFLHPITGSAIDISIGVRNFADRAGHTRPAHGRFGPRIPPPPRRPRRRLRVDNES